ncbi:protein MAIN-LIKE 1-like [Phaseolus vulgaris]|uniref:protein MAIN-LIKE 1-like n=1 Tax=Phaseolus vulgaris TaxID=3885 RepID=UPI0035CB8604
MSLLRLQDKHVTKDVWEGNERLLRPRRHAIWILKHEDILDQRVKQLIDHSGFGHLLKFKNIDFNHVLLTALVERWRSETHTFHFPLGETTVTLEDVELILGLPVDGQAVTGITNGDLVSLCEQFLVFIPPTTAVKGNAISLSWLNNTFQELPHHATDDVIAQHARAHILTLIGSLLMPDSSGSKFLWTPYRVDYVRRLITIEVSPIARAVVPLICFATVEFHQVDRVMRQFGFRQSIPHDPFNLDQLHKEDMRGRTDRYWPQYHVAWIAMWNDRHNCLIQGNQFNGNGHLHDKSTYMQWYINHTICYISPIESSSEDDVSENQNDDNEVEGTDDDIPPPPPPTLPSEQQPQ